MRAATITILVLLLASQIPARARVARVAVLSFETLSSHPEDEWVGPGFAETLTSKLTYVESALDLVERRRIADVMRANQIAQTDVELVEAQQVGTLLGSDYLVLGSVQLLGSVNNEDTPLQVNSRVVRVETGQIVGGQSVTMEGTADSLFEMQTNLAIQYCELLRIKLLASERQSMLTNMTMSLVSYRYFCLGNLHLDAENFEEAIQMYDLALRMHENYFPEAHHNQGTAYQRLAQSRSGTQEREMTAEEYENAVNRLVASNSRVFFEQGRMYMFRKKYELAISAFQKYIDNADVAKTVYWTNDLNVNCYGTSLAAGPVVLTHSMGDWYALDSMTGDLVYTLNKNTIGRESIYAQGAIFGRRLSSFVALDPQTAGELWQIGLDENERDIYAIACSDRVVVFASRPNRLAAYNSQNGDHLWNFEGVTVGPKMAVTDTALYGGRGNSVVSLDLRTGQVIRDVPLSMEPKTVVGTYPMAVAYDGDKDLVGVDMTIGSASWDLALEDGTDFQVHALEDTLILAPNSQAGTTAYSIETGEMKWHREDLKVSLWGLPVAEDGILYLNQEYDIVAIDLDSGDTWWSYPTSINAWSAPAVQDGRVYFASRWGVTTCLNAAGERPPQQDYKVRFQIARAHRLLGNLELSEQVLSDIRNNEKAMLSECALEQAYIARERQDWPKQTEHLIYSLINAKRAQDQIIIPDPSVISDSDDRRDDTELPSTEVAASLLQESLGFRWCAPLALAQQSLGSLELLATSHLAISENDLMIGLAPGFAEFEPDEPIMKRLTLLDKTINWHFTVGTPLRHGDLVLIQDAHDRVVAFNTGSGQVEWSIPDQSPEALKVFYDWSWTRWNYQKRSMALDEGTLYLVHNRGAVLAVDADTGRVRWAYAIGYDTRASPTYRNGKIFVGAYDAQLHAIDGAIGSTIWVAPLGGKIESAVVCDAEHVYAGSVDGSLTALDQDTGEPAWSFDTGGPILVQPTVFEDLVVASSADNSLYAIDRTSGRLVWSRRIGGRSRTPLDIQEGHLLVTTRQAVLGVNPATGDVRWAVPHLGSQYLSPALSEGTLYVPIGMRSAAVYALDVATLETSNAKHPQWIAPEIEVKRVKEELYESADAAEVKMTDAMHPLWVAPEVSVEPVEKRRSGSGWDARSRSSSIRRLAQLGEAELALREARRWTEEDAEAGHTWFLLGLIEAHLKQYEEALTHMLKGQELGYTRGTHWSVGLTADKAGLYDVARDAYTIAARSSIVRGRKAMACLNLAGALEARGQLDEALESYREALRDRVTHLHSWSSQEPDVMAVLRHYLQIEDNQEYRRRARLQLIKQYDLRFNIDYLELPALSDAIAKTRPDDEWFQGYVSAKRLSEGQDLQRHWLAVEKGLLKAESWQCPVGIELILRQVRAIPEGAKTIASPTVQRFLSEAVQEDAA